MLAVEVCTNKLPGSVSACSIVLLLPHIHVHGGYALAHGPYLVLWAALLQHVLAGVAQKASWIYLCMLHYVAAALLWLLPAAGVAVAAHPYIAWWKRWPCLGAWSISGFTAR